jgi:signal transduction histidine kinase/ActR/RegA family two-component response regulator
MIWRWRDWPWAWKLAALMVVAVMVPITAMTFVTELTERNQFIGDTRRRNLQQATNTSALLGRYLSDGIGDVTVLALSPAAVGACTTADPSDFTRLAVLMRGFKEAKHIELLQIIDRVGTVIAATNPARVGTDRITAPFFLSAMAGQARVHDPRYLPDDRQIHINISVPVHDPEDQIVGVAAARISLDDIDRLIAVDTDYGSLGEYGLLWDEQGIVLSSPAHPERRFRPLAPMAPYTRNQLAAEERFGPDTAKLLSASGAAEPLVTRSRWRLYDASLSPHVAASLDGRQMQVTLVPVPGTRWTYAIATPEDKALALVRAESSRNLAVALLTSIFAIVLSLVAARWVSSPLAQVGDAARALAAGDMTRRARLKRRDEIGELAATFDTMADALAAKDAELRLYADSLEQRVEERTAEVSGLLRDVQESNRLKDEFLSTVSHELRTPLNAVLGWAQVLKRTAAAADPAQTARALDAIERNAQAQAQLVEDLLDTSRVVSGKLHISFVPVDVCDIVQTAVESVRPLAKTGGIDLRLAVGEDRLPVLADPARLQQVIGNLLSNALKFTASGGRVSVSVRRSAETMEIVVTDTGRGIPGEFLPFVFDRFRQGDSTTTRAHGGLGLGLSIARHLVVLHGGTIRAESAGEQQGATFTIVLPGKMADATAARLPHAAPTTILLPGIRVLIVDDQEDARTLLAAILAAAGALVDTVGSAEEARRRLAARRPDVLVSDIAMPEEDGYSLIRSIRLADEAAGLTPLPSIAVTAYARDDDRSRALVAGYDRHLTKPLDPGALLEAIAELTLGRERRR